MREPPEDKRQPYDQQMFYAREAIKARAEFYRGLDRCVEEATFAHGTKSGPAIGEQIWNGDPQSGQTSARNKWHMLQSVMFGLLGMGRTLQAIDAKLGQQNELLRQQVLLLKGMAGRG